MTTITYKEFLLDAKQFLEKSNELSDGWFWVNYNAADSDIGKKYLRKCGNRLTIDSSHRYYCSMPTDKQIGKDIECSDDNDDLADICDLMQDTVVEASEQQDKNNIANITKKTEKERLQEHEYDYEILYCSSYRVPVLYFLGRDVSTGKRLRLEETWSDFDYFHRLNFIKNDDESQDESPGIDNTVTNIHDNEENRIDKMKMMGVITQSEHPVTNKICFQLHPCYTAEMMKNILSYRKTIISEAKSTRNDNSNCGQDFNYLLSWLSFVGPVIGLQVSAKFLKKL